MRLRWFAGLITVAGCLALGYPEVHGATAVGQTEEPLATGGLISSLRATPVVGEPYSAVQVHTATQTLADGSTVSHHGHHAVARDAEGRVHVELRLAVGRNGAPDEVMIFVMDPVAHTLTTWLSGAQGRPKTASVFKISADPKAVAAPPSPQNSPGTQRPQPIITTEDLGTKMMQGLEATGKRITTVVPAGRSGNSAPITKTHEIWTSTELQIVLKQQWTDPRAGERTVALENLSRANPDQSLFRPPADYEVKSAVESLKELEEKLAATQQ